MTSHLCKLDHVRLVVLWKEKLNWNGIDVDKLKDQLGSRYPQVSLDETRETLSMSSKRGSRELILDTLSVFAYLSDDDDHASAIEQIWNDWLSIRDSLRNPRIGSIHIDTFCNLGIDSQVSTDQLFSFDSSQVESFMGKTISCGIMMSSEDSGLSKLIALTQVRSEGDKSKHIVQASVFAEESKHFDSLHKVANKLVSDWSAFITSFLRDV